MSAPMTQSEYRPRWERLYGARCRRIFVLAAPEDVKISVSRHSERRNSSELREVDSAQMPRKLMNNDMHYGKFNWD